MTTPHSQAVEAAVQRVCAAYKATHFDNELRGSTLDALRAELARPQEVAAAVTEAITPEMVAAGAKAAREYMELTDGISMQVIYRAMREASRVPVASTYSAADVTDAHTKGYELGMRQVGRVPLASGAAIVQPVQPSAQDAKDAQNYRYLRDQRQVLLLTGFFGNGCINKTIEDVEIEIAAAITAKDAK